MVRNAILDAFPVCPIPMLVRNDVEDLGSNDDEWALVFNGRKWTDLTATDLKVGYEAFFHFNKEEFQYYLPALLSHARDGSDVAFALSAVFDPLIGNADSTKWSRWFKDKWLNLSIAQIEVIEGTLADLHASRQYPTHDWEFDSIRDTLDTVSLLILSCT